MRPVNLLPERYRRARPTGRRPGLAYAAVGGLAVLLILIVAYVVTDNKLTDAKNKTATANAEADRAQQQVNQLAAYGNFQQVKQARESAVRGLAGARFDWERTLREVALLTPRGVYLTTFDAAPAGQPAGTAAGTSATPGATAATGPSLTIGGCAPDYKTIATTIVRFRRLANATDVTLNSSQKSTAGGGTSAGGATGASCPVSWQAAVTFSAPTPQAPQRAPQRLGGGA